MYDRDPSAVAPFLQNTKSEHYYTVQLLIHNDVCIRNNEQVTMIISLTIDNGQKRWILPQMPLEVDLDNDRWRSGPLLPIHSDADGATAGQVRHNHRKK